MFATAAYFHNSRFLGVLTIFATVFAVFRSTTVASRVGTLSVFIFSHKWILSSRGNNLCVVPMLEPVTHRVKQGLVTVTAE